MLSDSLRSDGQLERSTEIALEGAEVARRAGLEMFERMCKLQRCAGRLRAGSMGPGRSASAREILVRDFTGMTLAFAQYLAGALARARGDLAGAAEHLAAKLHAVGPGPTPPASYTIDAEAELAMWEGRPEAALSAAEEGLRLQVEDPQRWMLIAALGAQAAADLAELARARRDAAAETAARERATAFRDGARDRAAHAAHPALAATIEAEHARAAGQQRSGAVGRGRARLGGAARAVSGRLRPLAPGRGGAGAARTRPSGAGAARRRTPWPPASARAPWKRRSKPWRTARGSRWRPPPEERAAADMPPAGADLGLTARELEVLQHLARGATNRQIAEALYISVRTAGVHVSHILGKLSAANRGEAAAIAHRLRTGALVRPSARGQFRTLDLPTAWARLDSNQDLTDYESAALTD